MRILEISLPSASAAAAILASGPTRIGSIRPSSTASNTAPKEAAIAGVGNGDLQLRKRLRGRHEPVVLVVLPLTMLRHTLG